MYMYDVQDPDRFQKKRFYAMTREFIKYLADGLFICWLFNSSLQNT